MTPAASTAIFGQTVHCQCGKTHRIQPDRIVIGQGYLDRLPEICSTATTGRRVAVLMDLRTRLVAGAAAAAALSEGGWDVLELIVEDPPGGWPVCDDLTKEALAGRLGEPDLIVTVGSGVLTDLGKWLAFERALPFVAVATAASMNGYASANVAPTLGGIKTLLRARPAVAVLAGTDILSRAPYEMTAAGLGDLLAKSVSSADWYLNHRLFGDDYCARSVGLIGEIEPLYLTHPRQVAALKPQMIEAMFLALLLTGAAMTMAETSAPASGAEHLVSHSLDMMASLDGRGHDLHGRQVGVGTVLAAELYRRVLAVESPQFIEPPGQVDGAFWGRLAPAVAEQYARKLPRLRAVEALLARGQRWDELRRELSGMVRSPQRIHDCLLGAGAACRAADIGIDRDRLRRAFQHAVEIRSRFTVLDLAWLMGLMPDAAGQIVEQWA